MKKVKSFRLLGFMLVFVLTFVSIFAGQVSYTITNEDWNYEVWKTDSTYLNLENTKLLSNYTPISKSVSYTIDYSSGYGRIFLYPANTEDYVFGKGGIDFSHSYSGFVSNFQKYTSAQLSQSGMGQLSCVAEINANSIISNLKNLKAGGQDMQNEEIVIPHLLDKYYSVVSG